MIHVLFLQVLDTVLGRKKSGQHGKLAFVIDKYNMIVNYYLDFPAYSDKTNIDSHYSWDIATTFGKVIGNQDSWEV